jgi:hypothetical protein
MKIQERIKERNYKFWREKRYRVAAHRGMGPSLITSLPWVGWDRRLHRQAGCIVFAETTNL